MKSNAKSGKERSVVRLDADHVGIGQSNVGRLPDRASAGTAAVVSSGGAMRSHIVSGLCAAGLTILVAAALHFASGPKIDPILTAPLMPAFFLATSLGVRGGPDGMPSMLYVFGLSFLFWWIAIDLVWRIWRWVAKNV
jgi:hypothetical protein